MQKGNGSDALNFHSYINLCTKLCKTEVLVELFLFFREDIETNNIIYF